MFIWLSAGRMTSCAPARWPPVPCKQTGYGFFLDIFAKCEEHEDDFAICEAPCWVHVISKSAWRRAVATDPTLEGPLAEWHKIASNAQWRSMMDVRQVYPHADFVDPFTVFNVKGGKYRLIVKIEYRWQMIFVKHVLTHDEYDKGAWKQ